MFHSDSELQYFVYKLHSTGARTKSIHPHKYSLEKVSVQPLSNNDGQRKFGSRYSVRTTWIRDPRGLLQIYWGRRIFSVQLSGLQVHTRQRWMLALVLLSTAEPYSGFRSVIMLYFADRLHDNEHAKSSSKVLGFEFGWIDIMTWEVEAQSSGYNLHYHYWFASSDKSIDPNERHTIRSSFME